MKNQDYANKILAYIGGHISGLSENTFTMTVDPVTENMVVEADRDFEYIITMMKSVYQVRKIIRIEGIKFDVGDFVVRIGSVVAAQQPKGIAVEVSFFVKVFIYKLF